MKNMPDFDHVSLSRYIIGLILNPTLVGGAALTAIFTFAQLSLFSWADLSYVIPCTASAYILTTLFGQVFMGEHVGLTRWIGVVLISFGVTLVAETPIATVEHQAEVKQC
jgi:drug/metabolite transporter (DMT)-like permease